jgi:plastocyanin
MIVLSKLMSDLKIKKMKKITLLLMLMSLFATVNAQIVITEIMYNPPESGNDTTEYIELLNISDQAINLQGYSFTEGVVLEFGNLSLAPGAYVLATKSNTAMNAYFGVEGVEWTDGSLSNSGEDIILTNSAGEVVDMVDFDDGGDWPSEADGSGYSLELCDPFKDNNDPANWKISITETETIIEGAVVFASPGVENEIECEDLIDHTVDVLGLMFDPKNLTINLNETVQWINSQGGNHNVNGSLSTYPENPEGFYSGAPSTDNWVYTHTFTKSGFYRYKCDLHGAFGMTGTIEVLAAEAGKLVINEIMYNDPSDADSLEFVEIHNLGNDEIFLDAFKLTANTLDFTFPDTSIAPGDFMVICQDSEAFQRHFGWMAMSWGDAKLNNNQDHLKILAPDGGIIDEVEYGDNPPWSSLADGLGHSLNLCRPELDNALGENWQECPQSSGTSINGYEVFANPGTASFCAYDIGEISEVDDRGALIYDDLGVEVIGIVHGVNLRPGALQLTIIDDKDDGIALFSSDANYGYEVHEGDRIIALGKTGQYNGLAQIYLDTLLFFGQQSPLSEPRIVTELNEDTESQLVTIENVSIKNPDVWGSGGSGFNVTATDGDNFYTVRIDDDVDLFNTNYPTGTFNLTGIGGQFDNTSPYFDGYQILPRYIEDIDPFLPNQYEKLSIGEISTVDENGVADSVGVKCEIEGVVYGINYNPNGLSVTIIDDNNDGINIYSGGNGTGYEVSEGDRIRLKGEVDQYNGLIEFRPDEISLVSSGNELMEAIDVTDLNESTESQLVKIAFLSLVDESEWEGDGGSFNVRVSNGQKEFVMRIDNDCELSAMQAPSGVFHATGLGSQYDTSEPYTEGYQLFPRYATDIDIADNNTLVNGEQAVKVFPNPFTQHIKITSSLNIESIEIYDLFGRLLASIKTDDQKSFDLSELDRGVYVLRIKGEFPTLIKRLTKSE